MSPEMQSRVEVWRRKAIDGTLTPEEELEAVRAIRGDRRSAAVASETSRTKKAAASVPLPSGDDLLSEMLG